MAQQESSSSLAYTYTHDIFLNFRGEDTRTGFTGNLYNALRQRGFSTFMDDEGLERGEEIGPTIVKAIEESSTAIIVFSQNYASSGFCLDELVKILECAKVYGQWICPIFYNVNPSDVRHQRGSFGEGLARYHRGKLKDNMKKVKRWRWALREVANFSGWHFESGGEYEHVFIRRIVEGVSSKLNQPLLHVANYPVGLKDRVREVQSLIEFDDKVNMLGIYGIGGMGKSTIARALYNLVAYQFEGSCFLADVREKSNKHGLVRIQETMLFELVGETNIKLGDVNQGIPILKRRFQNKKVLVILDDVNKMEQLQATAGRSDWFGPGSMIVITTRDKHLLDIHGVKKIYEVKEFNDTEALELFRWSAFKNEEVDPSHMEIIKRAVHYARGHPLVLETIGSNLFGKTLDEWKYALDAYERIPNRNIEEILRVSYNGLEEHQKEIYDRAVLDHHPAKASTKSSQAPDVAETQYIQAPSPASSSGEVSGGELHLETSSNVSPTTIDQSFINQTELTQDDLEREAFCTSLGTETPVLSHSQPDKLAEEEAMEALLKVVQDFISNDASILLNHEWRSAMKTSLDYLSNLSVDDGIWREIRALISEASRELTSWSRHYIEASRKIASTASELLRADELEAGLEGNKNKLRKVVASENELLDKLAYMEDCKKKLEEQINAIKANISASQSEKNMTRKRKRDIYEETKTLITQRDEFREKTPHLQHEQGLAKETQAKITAEWSKLGEKLKKIASEMHGRVI